MAPAPLDRLRTLCLALPETTERLSHGEPSWFVRDKKQRGSGGSADRSPQEPELARATKAFVMLSDHHHDDRFGFWCAAPPGVQESLVADRAVAPKRLVAALEQRE